MAFNKSKFFLSFTALILGLCAQFYPVPFPQNASVLTVLVAIYFICYYGSQYWKWLYPKNFIAKMISKVSLPNKESFLIVS